MRVYMICSLMAVGCLFLLGGCGGTAQKQVPHMAFGGLNIETDITRSDIVVLDQVEGSSTTTSVCLGIIQVIDGDKLRLFWIFPFFVEKYTPLADGDWITTASRAYYKALENAPEADAVFCKSWDREQSGNPLLWGKETVTFKGKAIKLKSDK